MEATVAHSNHVRRWNLTIVHSETISIGDKSHMGQAQANEQRQRVRSGALQHAWLTFVAEQNLLLSRLSRNAGWVAA